MRALYTKLTIPCSKIFTEIEKYNPYSKYISSKKCCKKRGGIRTEFTIHNSEIFPEIEKYISQFYFLLNMLQKKRRDFIQNSPFLATKYFQTQENTIFGSKIFLSKNVGKNEGDMSYRIHSYLTKFSHVGIEKYKRNTRILRYKIFPIPTQKN